MDIHRINRACAACKYQRRKCTPDCPLAPYFPADKPKMLANAHRLFGISNMVKTLKSIDDDDHKDEAMKSIIFESEMRARFPSHGCLGLIMEYQDMIIESMKELDRVKQLLNLCKLSQQQNLRHFSSLDYSSVPSTSSSIPISNNVGDVPYYDHNSENNNEYSSSWKS